MVGISRRNEPPSRRAMPALEHARSVWSSQAARKRVAPALSRPRRPRGKKKRAATDPTPRTAPSKHGLCGKMPCVLSWRMQNSFWSRLAS
jgi:hypothetical protein